MATMNTTITSQTHYVAVTDDMLTIREKRSFLPDSDTWGCLFGLFMILFLFWGSWHAVQAEMDDPGVVLRYFLAKKFRITGVDNPLLNFLSWVLSFGYFVLIGGFLLWVVLFVLIIGVPLVIRGLYRRFQYGRVDWLFDRKRGLVINPWGTECPLQPITAVIVEGLPVHRASGLTRTFSLQLDGKFSPTNKPSRFFRLLGWTVFNGYYDFRVNIDELSSAREVAKALAGFLGVPLRTTCGVKESDFT